MGGIALPALHLNPPAAPPNVMEQYGQLLQLKNAMANAPLQHQIMQQQAQEGQLDVQAKQIAMKDQQAMSAAMQQWGQPKTPAAPAPAGANGAAPTAPTATATAPNYDDLVELARKNGASFNAIKGLQTQILDMKDKASSIVKNDAQAGSANANAMKTKNGMIVDAMTGVMNLPDEQIAPALLQTAQQLASQGLLDPQHIQMAQQLAQSGNPTAIRQQLDVYAKSLGGFSKMIDDAQKKAELVKTQGASDPNSPFYAPSATAVTLGTAPKAAEIKAGEVNQKARVSAAEAAAKQPFEMALARQKQALSQGDPNAAAQLLLDGDATLSELKARGSTPDFIAKTLAAAHQKSNGTYNAQQADAQFSVAKSPANVQFFGAAKSLTDKGGTLDQLAAAGKEIPGGMIPAFNSIADWEKAATGNGPIAKYATIALGVADDGAKVMGGGVATDSGRTQILQNLGAKLSPAQRVGAIEGMRGSVASQIKSRIGNNTVLNRMYGEPQAQSTATASPLTVTAPNGKVYTFKDQASADAFKKNAGIQ